MKLPIPQEILAQHVAILGKTRSGKSSVMRLLVEDLLERHQPVCIVDPKGDWYGIKLAGAGGKAGYPVVIFGGEHADIPIDKHAGAAIAEIFATGNHPCLIDLGGWTVEDRTTFWIAFTSTLFKLTKGTRWLAVDEVHNFCPKGRVWSPEAGKALHWTNRIASEGLGKGLSMLFASQRPQKVHNDTLTSAETLIAMRVLHPSDRGAVAEWIEGCGDSSGKDVLASLAQMDRGEGWVWSPENGFGPKRVRFPLFRTYDSFRAQTVGDSKRLTGWAETDLEAFKQKFASNIERAKADDPKVLQKQIADLKRQLAAKPAAAPPPAKVVQKPVLKDAQIRYLERTIEQYRKSSERSSNFLAATDKKIAELGALILAAGPEPIFKTPVVKAPRPVRAVTRPTLHPPAGQPRTVPAGVAPNGIAPAAQRILDALAELETMGVPQPERIQVAFMSGYTNLTSKGFSNGVGALRSGGLIDYAPGGRMFLTQDGRAQANEPEVVRTPQELQQRVMNLVGGACAKVLKPLLDAYPKSVARQDLAAAAGYGNQTSKGFANVIGRLRSLGFIDYPSPGQVAACPVLFLEETRT